jgi:glycosyltransferase involved in cell wall biosynthesis
VPQIKGHIDQPAAGAEVDAFGVTFRGWAHSTGAPVTLVTISVDGIPIASTARRHPRPDVARALGAPAAMHSGFEATIDALPHGNAWFDVSVVAVCADGATAEIGRVPALRVRALKGQIDEPSNGGVVDLDDVVVRGWVHAPGGMVTRVDVLLDGAPIGKATLRRPRPDVVAMFSTVGTQLCGFEFRGPVDLPLAGEPTLTARATLHDGRVERVGAAQVVVRPRRTDRPVRVGRRPVRRAPVGTPLRVLWSARSLDNGGSQLRMADLIEHLATRGFAHTVLSPSDGPLRGRLESKGATVILAESTFHDDPIEYDRVVASLMHRVEHFDLVVGFTMTNFAAVDAASVMGVPSVVRLGEAARLRDVVRWLGDTLHPDVNDRARVALASAQCVVSNSHAAVGTFQDDRFDADYHVIPTGVAVRGPRPDASDRRGRSRAELGLPPTARVVVLPATIWPLKDQALLVDAMRVVANRHPDLVAVLIGQRVEPYAEFVSEMVEHTGLAGNVRVESFVDDLSSWWDAGDAVICTSHAEALPASVLEGMAHGRPALVVRSGDLPDVVSPGEDGWHFDPSDLDSLIEALTSFAETSSETLASMGAAARNTVARRYNHLAMFEAYERLLRGVATGVAGDYSRWQRSHA